jgi:MYXO-CTERM domain-containing protein
VWSVPAQPKRKRFGHSALLLSDGTVLVAGGKTNLTSTACPGYVYDGSVERYDPAANAWHMVGGLTAPRASSTLVELADGRVLSAGGLLQGGSYIAAVEIFQTGGDAGTGSDGGSDGGPDADAGTPPGGGTADGGGDPGVSPGSPGTPASGGDGGCTTTSGHRGGWGPAALALLAIAALVRRRLR